ncbi:MULTISPECIES: ribose ABC transporter permease [Psychrilyobacter]|uniref:Ribose ABC transporter permease n=1 Tax=Psychrilyobacter piezotolerans TaxID=2293438 RepID=A0ABX9KGV7_9FUSO|nr:MULTISPECIES: ribose ABC transporter permease [Psychrilyobacter]MCS5422953.1 ribose ABC transporter permease [Psychrilyobacter sp. S5]NDI77705.1 ribose ABC transporter permease [Psychrilyobacter piezotolerans]RDE61405.1 ribose ABC transporter permease [Psychrilyobacter sp. S5]REI40926.1 ribose ABC transporter permease [Psychrilyobacter piezotolerans]
MKTSAVLNGATIKKENKLLKNKPLIGLIIFGVIVSILNPRFLSTANLLNILRQTSINAIIAAGMTFVILTGGIDLSVGSILAICGAVSASMLAGGVNGYIVLIVTIILGTILGAVSGSFISYGKLQAFITTLVAMTLLRGATLVFTDGKPISMGFGENAELFDTIGGGYLFGIPVPIYIMIAVFAVCNYVLKNTKFGRYVFAVGGNEEATKLSGINVEKLKVKVYAISGGLAALAGIIITSRLGSAQPTAGTGYELDAIAAVVLGGTSLSGGIGSISGTITGALIIGVLGNALNLLDVSSYYQMMIKALVILAAVLIDRKTHK